MLASFYLRKLLKKETNQNNNKIKIILLVFIFFLLSLSVFLVFDFFYFFFYFLYEFLILGRESWCWSKTHLYWAHNPYVRLMIGLDKWKTIEEEKSWRGRERKKKSSCPVCFLSLSLSLPPCCRRPISLYCYCWWDKVHSK